MRIWLILILLTLSAGIMQAQPANDNFANAAPVGATPSLGTDFNASLEPGEPHIDGITNTVWWSWIAPNSGLAWVDLDGSIGDYYVEIYTGTNVASLSSVSEISSPLPTPLSGTFAAVAGTKYYFQVSGYGGDIVLSVRPDAMLLSDLDTNFDASTGTTEFTASVEVQNSGSRQQAIDVDLVARAGYVELTNAIPTNELPSDITLGSYIENLAPGAVADFVVSNICPAAYLTNGAGVEWTIYIDYNGSYPYSTFLFQGEQTSLGPGSIVVPPPVTNNPDAPFYPIFSAIDGPSTVLEDSTNNYAGTVIITNGSVGATVNFSNTFWMISPTNSFTIDSNGDFTAGLVTSNTVVTISAEYPLSGTNYYITTNIVVLVPLRPIIVAQPVDQLVGLGQPASFAVTASGSDLSYQWSFDGQPLADATNSGLTIPETQLTDIGTYSVVVSNSIGSAAVSNLTLLVPLNEASTTDGVILLTNGDGVIQHAAWPRSLSDGKPYTVTAVPRPNNLFSAWVGGTNPPYSVLSSSAAYKFTMHPDLVLEANFVTNPFFAVAGVYNGLFTNISGVTEETAGMLKSLSVSQKGIYSGTLLVNGASEAISGSFNLAGHATNTISRASLTVAMTLQGNLSPPQLTGTVSSREPAWVSSLMAERAANTPLPAAYTMLIQPDPYVAPFDLSPGGDGYALISESKGTAKITGALADGTAFTQSTPVSFSGDVPIYASLYHNQGLLLGWINLDPTNTANASLAWVHPRTSTSLFQNAFISTNPVALSPWTSPPPESFLANFTNFAIIEAINKTQAATNNLPISFADNFKLEGVSGSLASKTGLLTVTTGAGAAKLTAHGVILQNHTNGGGYFLTLTNAGAIQLGP